MIDALIKMLRRDGEPMTETLRRACIMTLEGQIKRIAELEATLIVANDRIAKLEINHAPIGLSDAINKHAADVEAELRSDLAVARKALLDHHK